METMITHLFVYSLLFSLLRTSITLDTITQGGLIRDGDTLVSARRTFALGFFSPGSSKSRYVGIWYVISSEIVVWVANRDTPLNDHSGLLTVTDEGALVLLNRTNNIVWSSNSSRRSSAENPVAQLLDNGNLVVIDGNVDDPNKFLWQSFDYPCDTLLPAMKIGRNFVTGFDRFLSSWKSAEDPAQGQFSLRIDPHGFPQLVVLDGARIKVRSGPWNGLHFTGYPLRKQNISVQPEFVLNENEVYYEFTSALTRLVLNPSGIGETLIWADQTRNWQLIFARIWEADECQKYALCGAFSTCNPSSSILCACLEGFIPKSTKDRKLIDWFNGCVRSTPLACNGGDGFRKYTGLKLPDTSSSWFNKTMNLRQCEEFCLENCSCTAYSNLDIRGNGSGCLIWFGDLIDIKYTQGGQDQLYIRIASSELDRSSSNGTVADKGLHHLWKIVVLPTSLAMLILVLFVYHVRRKQLRQKGENLLLFDLGMNLKTNNSELIEVNYNGNGRKREVKMPLFSFASVSAATDNFSIANKLGEGGFGPVYKGILAKGYEVAIKRLSRRSSQGWEELKNEAMVIAKLQHKNLVRLLGCCIERDEKLLVYEYMPNKSLDFFLFDSEKRRILDWGTRVRVIEGIAQGLLYLHQYSRLRIIHRDLKPSNILLDIDMNPKISDFGMARIFRGNESQANTDRIVGTYGYMSPEYALRGLFSVKSDVFSFGVLLLEIVCGKKNTDFYLTNSLHLLGHAWDLWTSNRGSDLVDPLLEIPFISMDAVSRFVNIGLLCVQERAVDRPTMSEVVVMLNSESADLPYPKQPAFFIVRSMVMANPVHSRQKEIGSVNDATISDIEGR